MAPTGRNPTLPLLSKPSLRSEGAFDSLPRLQTGGANLHVSLDDSTIKKMDPAFSVTGETFVVGDDANRRALTVQLAEQLHNRLAITGIEIARGFVRKQNGGLARQRARDGHALLLAAGKLRRVMVAPVRHSDLVQ
jgi:hypothetical protein